MTNIDYNTIKSCNRLLSANSNLEEIKYLRFLMENMIDLCKKHGVEELPVNDSLLLNLLLVFNDYISDDKIEYVKYRLENFRYSVLEDDLATGRICKIQSHGSLSRDGWSRDFLYLLPNSSVLSHVHDDNIEIYNCIDGIMKVNGVVLDTDIVGLGGTHSIDEVNSLSIIETYKLSQEKLSEESIDSMNKQLQKVFVNKK